MVQVLYILNNPNLTPARWSRGMIRASGARGPGFKSRTSPEILQLYDRQLIHIICQCHILALPCKPVLSFKSPWSNSHGCFIENNSSWLSLYQNEHLQSGGLYICVHTTLVHLSRCDHFCQSFMNPLISVGAIYVYEILLHCRHQSFTYGSLVQGYDSRLGCERSRVQIPDEPEYF